MFSTGRRCGKSTYFWERFKYMARQGKHVAYVSLDRTVIAKDGQFEIRPTRKRDENPPTDRA